MFGLRDSASLWPVSVKNVADGVLSVLFAPACAACQHVLEHPTAGPVCADCWGRVLPFVPPLCRICGDSLPSWRLLALETRVCARCRRNPLSIERGCAAGPYEGTLRGIIHAFKYDGRTSLARPLASMMRSSGADILRDVHCAVPVPLHLWRRLRRGFNQADELARRLDVPVVHALWRTRATAPQTGLTARERRRNVGSVFALSPRMWRPSARRRWLEDRCVVLVDDVWTTGATLDACARVLKAAGVREVRALTAARAAPPRRSRRTISHEEHEERQDQTTS